MLGKLDLILNDYIEKTEHLIWASSDDTPRALHARLRNEHKQAEISLRSLVKRLCSAGTITGPSKEELMRSVCIGIDRGAPGKDKTVHVIGVQDQGKGNFSIIGIGEEETEPSADYPHNKAPSLTPDHKDSTETKSTCLNQTKDLPPPNVDTMLTNCRQDVGPIKHLKTQNNKHVKSDSNQLTSMIRTFLENTKDPVILKSIQNQILQNDYEHDINTNTSTNIKVALAELKLADIRVTTIIELLERDETIALANSLKTVRDVFIRKASLNLRREIGLRSLEEE